MLSPRQIKIIEFGAVKARCLNYRPKSIVILGGPDESFDFLKNAVLNLLRLSPDTRGHFKIQYKYT